MKTTADALTIVRNILTAQGGVTVPVYKLVKPTNQDPEKYIVINALPISKGVLQTTIVNVNYYVKDRAYGVPNTAELASGTNSVVSILGMTHGKNYLLDFESENLEFDRDLERHYSNIRIAVKQIN